MRQAPRNQTNPMMVGLDVWEKNSASTAGYSTLINGENSPMIEISYPHTSLGLMMILEGDPTLEANQRHHDVE